MSKSVDNIDDILIVRKISKSEPACSTNDEGEILSASDLDEQQHLIAEEQEIIIRKGLQLLQADERGKQALISELNALRQKQEKRAQLLRYRQQALSIEKERAKKLAMLPPPLPMSVKLLLKKKVDKSNSDKPDVQMPDELQAFPMKGVQRHVEDKENIFDPEELEAKQKMQEEMQTKAKKRFNEALKKDRQKEEYSKVMKEIQNAELLNRRKLAKSISSEKKSIPCPLSDKFQIEQKQTEMEEAAEKVFKKMSKKEHVIEDIEGYQDFYEQKYKKIDSEFESKMIDCVPDFVRENYEYLLEDNSKFQGGKNFSSLDDSSSDILNDAYIETPPEHREGDKDIDHIINHLDKLRSENQAEYDLTLKPLLVAAISEHDIPKKESSDKAVDTEIIVEDKAVETDPTYLAEKNTSPPLPIPDFMKKGVKAFKKRLNGPYLAPFSKYVPDMHRRDVHYPVPSSTCSTLTPTSWSSSSYCSLPSQHGIPNFLTSTECAKCDICVAETEKDSIKNTLPQELHQNPVSPGAKKSDKSTSLKKAQLSKYVKLIAEKYLGPRPNLNEKSKDNETKVLQKNVNVLDHSNTEVVNSAFKKEVVTTFKKGFSKEQNTEEIFENSVKKVDGQHTISNRKESCENDDIDKKHDDIYDKIITVNSPKSPKEISEYDIEAKRIQLIQQVFERRIPRFTLDSSQETTSVNSLAQIYEDKSQTNNLSGPGQSRLNARPHVYHELSTILEMDSALTADSYHASQSKIFDTSDVKEKSKMVQKEASDGNLELSGEGLKIVSLLDPPDSSVAELTKSIHFVSRTQERKIQSSEAPQTSSTECVDAVIVSSKSSSLVPSSLTSCSDSNSQNSGSSYGKVFTSSLAGDEKNPYLKDTKFLNSYFSNVSDIPEKSPVSEMYRTQKMATCISSPLSSPASFKIGPNSKVKKNNEHSLILETNDSPVFSSNQSILHKTGAHSKKPKDAAFSSSNINSPAFTIHSTPCASNTKLTGDGTNVPSLISGYIYNKSNAPESFHPMTPHSDISSPTLRNDEISNYIESTQVKQVLSEKKVISTSSSDTSRSFKPLTPCSYISSPSFHPMTPHSDISSPTLRNDEFSNYIKESAQVKQVLSEKNVISSSSSDTSRSFKPLTPCSYISALSERPKSVLDYYAYSNSGERFEALTPVSMVSTPSLPNNAAKFNYEKGSDSSEFYPLKVGPDISTDTISSRNETNYPNTKEKFISQNYHLTLKNNVPENITNNVKKISSATEFVDNLTLQEKNILKSKAQINSKVCSSDFFTPQFCAADILNIEKKKTYLESDTEMKSKESYVKKDFEIARGVCKQISNLAMVSSASSSTENLSVISGSKVLHQSTPIKSMEEIAQECGILEEPDLTLVTTNYSSKIDLNENECVTPPNQSIQLLGPADTPSMLSFLQHENSCMKDTTNCSNLMLFKSPILTSDAVEKQASVKENPEFEKPKYKQRTERLWNNLEEVKKRNLEKERKKIVAANRLKAKEFAKKLTPRRK